jgi:hypothetical protein
MVSVNPDWSPSIGSRKTVASPRLAVRGSLHALARNMTFLCNCQRRDCPHGRRIRKAGSCLVTLHGMSNKRAAAVRRALRESACESLTNVYIYFSVVYEYFLTLILAILAALCIGAPGYGAPIVTADGVAECHPDSALA